MQDVCLPLRKHCVPVHLPYNTGMTTAWLWLVVVELLGFCVALIVLEV